MSIRLAHKICPLCGTFYSYDPHAIGMRAKRCPECRGSIIKAVNEECDGKTTFNAFFVYDDRNRD